MFFVPVHDQAREVTANVTIAASAKYRDIFLVDISENGTDSVKRYATDSSVDAVIAFLLEIHNVLYP